MNKTIPFSRTIMLLSIIGFFMVSHAQNKVGIGTTNPQEELDVQGDINLTGVLKMNNQAGAEGQILQVQSGGTMAWVDACKYSYYMTFDYPYSQTWTVPAGINQVGVELWGGGGYGYVGGGGGAGGYARADLEVYPGQVLNLTIGVGATSSQSSGNSRIDYYTSEYLQAFGGYNATSGNSPGQGGNGGSYISSHVLSWLEYRGGDGNPTHYRYEERSTGNFVRNYVYGDGGASPTVGNNGGKGGSRIISEPTGTYIMGFTGTTGAPPGSGGGGNVSIRNGHAGRVVVYW